MNNPMDLTGRKILITGASSGIGKACAQLAAELGAVCVLVARNTEKLEGVRLSLADADRHYVFPFDLMDIDGIAELMKSIVKGIGPLNGLVHSAGVGPAIPLMMVTKEEIEKVMNLNYSSFLLLVKEFQRKKNHSLPASIVAVSSVSAFIGWRAGSIYSGSKGALSATVRSLALELLTKKIRINAVCPANVKTPLFTSMAGELRDGQQLDDLVITQQPLGLLEPNDVANPVCFLLSDASRMMTGINLPVDAGYLAQ